MIDLFLERNTIQSDSDTVRTLSLATIAVSTENEICATVFTVPTACPDYDIFLLASSIPRDIL